jgi:hypothetical protein
MIYLGSERIVTNDFSSHSTAEDYSGNHLSNVSIIGSGKVIKVINSFHSHEDSINYNDYLNNKNSWKDGNYYNCISITGKSVRMHYSELGGNQIYIETFYNNQKITLHFAHLDSVLVNVGDIVSSNQVFALQGNTGLVLSNKDINDITYGSHVHLEVIDSNGNYLNPREFASGSVVTNYIEQTNVVDNSKKQIQILVDKINIREEANETSNDLGDVYFNEVYTILEEIDSTNYTWYKITTNLGLTGYVASKKDSNWIKVIEATEDIIDEIKISDDKENYQFLFKCEKEDYYYIKLQENECLYIKRSI